MASHRILLLSILLIVFPGLPVVGDEPDHGSQEEPAANPELPTVADVVERVSAATVSIRTAQADGSLASGSGFVVDSSGLVATNFHVVEGATELQVKLANGDQFQVLNVYATDPTKDLAIVRIAGFELPTVEFGNSDKLRPGEDLIVIGDPEGFERSVSKGVLSAVRQLEGLRVLQMDAAVSPGSSGGPILNTMGLVVGITSFKWVEGEQLNFGIPANYLRGLMAVDQQQPVESLSSTGTNTNLFGEVTVTPRPGVIVSGYGGADSYGRVHLDVLNYLSENGIAVANVPTEWQPVSGDSVALPFILEWIRDSGTNELLYITSDSSYGFWAGGKAQIEFQCYGPDGTLAWKSQVKRSGSWSTSAATEKVRKKLEKELGARMGGPCLATKVPEPEKDESHE